MVKAKMDGILLEKHGHHGYGDPPDPRKPALEFYVVGADNYGLDTVHYDPRPMAWDANDDIAYNRPRSSAHTREMIGFPLTKHQPLHVDRAAEKKRKEIELYRNLNGGMGFSTATWMRRGVREDKENYIPFRSAGANYPPRTARGQIQNLYPGKTRPHSADLRRTRPLYTGQGEINRGPLIHFEGPVNRNILPEEPPWDPEWPEPNDTHRPVVARLKNPPQVDGRGEKLVINGLRSMFEVQERRGNRQAARKFGEGGLFQQEGGRWLKRMWKDNAWAEPGGIRGSMRNGPTNCSERHHPVADGFAPARIVGDGWGAKKWPQKGRCAREAVVRGAQHLTLQPHREQQAQPILNRDDVMSGGSIILAHPIRAGLERTRGRERRSTSDPAAGSSPLSSQVCNWRDRRGNCPFPHGEDGREDLLHGEYQNASVALTACEGLPYDGVSKGLSRGRVLRLHGPLPVKLPRPC
uniref:Uncharacterized protein n=1 Tax=Guillardia theta TaxID=55529 RepID=A0A7S4M0D2_GUITH